MRTHDHRRKRTTGHFQPYDTRGGENKSSETQIEALEIGGDKEDAMLKVEGVRSVNWNAPDATAAERFYTDVLGANVRDRMNIGGADVAHLMLGTTMVGLFDASGGPRPGVPHHTLQMAWPGEMNAAKV